jgi:hypothetical protein
MFAMASIGEKQRRRVMRVGFEPHQLVRAPVIDDALHRLAGQAPVAGDMRDRQWRGREGDGAQDLPAGAGQAEVMNERVAGFDQVAVEAKTSMTRPDKARDPGWPAPALEKTLRPSHFRSRVPI